MLERFAEMNNLENLTYEELNQLKSKYLNSLIEKKEGYVDPKIPNYVLKFK